MPQDEIEIPKEIREFMLVEAQETRLGQKNGAKKQFRYGNLHIREYNDKFLVHNDKVDPRKDPIGHLIHDSPEVLVGLGCAIVGGTKIANELLNNKPKKSTIVYSLVSSIIIGYIGYATTKKIKNYLR